MAYSDNNYYFLCEAAINYELMALASKVHGPYHRADGRQIVIIVNDDGSRRTVSYPKYLVEQHLGTILNPNTQTIDHINRDHNDNNLNNLRIVERSQHSKDDTRRVKLIKCKCAWCGVEFDRSPRLLRDKAKKNRAGPFCCRSHAGMYSRCLQLKLIDKFDTQKSVDSEYYRNEKNIESVASFLEKKYARYI